MPKQSCELQAKAQHNLRQQLPQNLILEAFGQWFCLMSYVVCDVGLEQDRSR